MTDYTYTYERGIDTDGDFLIKNKKYTKEDGSQVFLANKIEEIFTADLFKVFCEASSCNIVFQRELTIEEQATLALIVNDYKNYTPPQ